MQNFEIILASKKAVEEIEKLKLELESLINRLGILKSHSQRLMDVAGHYGVLGIMKISNSNKYKFIRELPIRRIDDNWQPSNIIRDASEFPENIPIERWGIFGHNVEDLANLALDLLDVKYESLIVDINPLTPAQYEEIHCLWDRLQKDLEKITPEELREIKNFLLKNGFNPDFADT